jgi:outer membrane protein OmpA-like peptidoglycan-associated protein
MRASSFKSALGVAAASVVVAVVAVVLTAALPTGVVGMLGADVAYAQDSLALRAEGARGLPASSSHDSDSQGSQGSDAAEPWLLMLEGMGAYPLTAPQNDWFGVGAAVGVGVYKSLAPVFSMGLKLRGLWLRENSGGTAEVQQGVLGAGMLALRVRPFGRHDDVRRATGFWIEGAGGAGWTDGFVRPTIEGGLGWLFAISRRTSIGPTLRYMQVIQPSGDRDGRDARIAMAGVEIAFFDATPVEKKKVPPAPPAVVKVEDRDHDGVTDNIDQCPDEVEDLDQFQDDDGCPDPDNDQDGIADWQDKCPNEAEDKDGIGDDDGCPETDQDNDGIADEKDKCPLQPEVINGVQDDDGCPDQGLIEFVQDRVVLEERVLFDFERVRVRSRAKPVLAAIVELWRQHPDWKTMRVEGHADVRGGDGVNQAISEKRARNVAKELIKLGFPQDKIDWIGWGKTKPIELGETESAQRRNRRVEFVVTSMTSQNEKDAAPAVQEKKLPAPRVPTKLPSTVEAPPNEQESGAVMGSQVEGGNP